MFLNYFDSHKYKFFLIKYEDLISNTDKIFLNVLEYIHKLTNLKFEINEKKFKNSIDTTDFEKLKSIEINVKNLLKYDAVLITTDHSVIDYELVYENSKVIFDTRGVYRNKSKKIIQC